MTVGLSVSRIVNVDVSFAPVGAPAARFDTLLVLGDSDVVDTGEVLREYNSLDEVAADFGTTAPEYLAADLYFSQTPQPNTLFIGRWAQTATKGLVAGGFLSSTEQLLSAWTGITNGGFHVSIDGSVSTNITGLNFSAALNLNGIASIIQTAVRAVGSGGFTLASVVWTGSQFRIKSGTSGASSTVSYLTAPTSGTDISGQLKMTSALAERTVAGIAAETPVACVTRVDGRGWYAVMFAATVMPSESQLLAVAAYIEGAADRHLLGITTQAANTLDSATTADLASQLSLAGYLRTAIQYSVENLYAMASFFGRAFTVDFSGSNTTITMKFKQEPGVIPEVISATQASTLMSKRCNVYAQYNNGTAILQEGMMSGPAFFDEMHDLDWLANAIQTELFNKLYQSPKIPQTNPGVHVLVATCEGRLNQGVVNGMLAPGVWNAAGFGQLVDGQYLPKGWYTYAASVDDQAQSDREARRSPLIQIAVKMAGAIHFADALINVNR